MIAHYSLHIPKCPIYKYEVLPEEKQEEYFDEHDGSLLCSCPNTSITVNLGPTTSKTEYVESDLLLLVSQRNTATINTFYHQGYNSLAIPTSDLFNQYIDKERQVEILKFVWTELDIEKQNVTLRSLAEKNLAIFTLEYSLFLERLHNNKIHKSNMSRNLSQRNYLTWNRKGLILAKLDTCCLRNKKDRTLTYFVIERIYKMPAIHKKPLKTHTALRVFTSELNLEELPSPTWAKTVRTGDEFFPKEEWLNLRQQELSQLQENEKTLLC